MLTRVVSSDIAITSSRQSRVAGRLPPGGHLDLDLHARLAAHHPPRATSSACMSPTRWSVEAAEGATHVAGIARGAHAGQGGDHHGGIGRGGDLRRARRRARIGWRSCSTRAGCASAITSRCAWRTAPRYLEVTWAAQRSGLVYTPINFHLTAEEMAYIVGDCDARALIVSARARRHGDGARARSSPTAGRRSASPPAARLPGYESYEDAVAAQPADARSPRSSRARRCSTPPAPPAGRRASRSHTRASPMGSALPLLRDLLPAVRGRRRRRVPVAGAALPRRAAALLHERPARRRHGGGDGALRSGRGAGAASSATSVTHSQWVPTMFVRLLKLPDAERARATTCRSHRVAIHAAAPCPVPVKEQMIDWWGPILLEYYSSTEGIGATAIDSAEWLAHRGSVGRAARRHHPHPRRRRPRAAARRGRARLLRVAAAGAGGVPQGPDQDRARCATRAAGRSVGDVGYLDAEGYLYLTDRKDFMIVSGGVNIYPQEIENLLVTHPQVADVAVFGVPNDEMGEEVKAVVQPARHGRGRPRARRGAAGLLPPAPRPLQVPAHDRLHRRAAARPDRQALQAAAARQVLGGAVDADLN